MKINKKLLFQIAFLTLPFFIFSQNRTEIKPNKNQEVFSKSDTANWVYILNDKSLHPLDVFKMDSGVLKISGLSSGYLRTKKSYKNYTLKLEWRWLKSPGNSGVLVHIQPKDSIWPVCYQVQQKTNAAGDIICMNGLWAKECKDSVKFTVNKLKPSNEKPLGEWNAMEIICTNDKISVFVNGELQNEITGLTVRSGTIGLQNEGKPLEFRNFTIKRL
jgi:hypothetical protein